MPTTQSTQSTNTQSRPEKKPEKKDEKSKLSEEVRKALSEMGLGLGF